MTRDGGKWWSKDHHLVVVKIVKNVAFSLKMLKNGESYKKFLKNDKNKNKNIQFLYKFKTGT